LIPILIVALLAPFTRAEEESAPTPAPVIDLGKIRIKGKARGPFVQIVEDPEIPPEALSHVAEGQVDTLAKGLMEKKAAAPHPAPSLTPTKEAR
jgi:hypothetical protein